MTGDLRTELAAALAAAGLDLTEQNTMYQPDAGIRRWEAHDGERVVIVEHWAKRADPAARWWVQIRASGALIELAENVTAARAVDACVLAGLLPAEQGSQYRAGIRHAVRAQTTDDGADL